VLAVAAAGDIRRWMEGLMCERRTGKWDTKGRRLGRVADESRRHTRRVEYSNTAKAAYIAKNEFSIYIQNYNAIVRRCLLPLFFYESLLDRDQSVDKTIFCEPCPVPPENGLIGIGRESEA